MLIVAILLSRLLRSMLEMNKQGALEATTPS